jgi:hypothetical protein
LPVAESKTSNLEFLDISEPTEPSSVAERGSDKSSTSEPPEPLPGLVSQEFVPPKDGTYRLHPELTHDYGSPEAPPADDVAAELEVEIAEDVELQSSGASEFRVPNAAEDFMEAGASPAPPPPSVEIETAPPPVYEPPEPVEIAPTVVQAPPPVLQPSSAMQAPPPAAEPPLVVEAPPTSPPRRSYSVRETLGQSVGSFFQALLSARPPGASATPTSTTVPPPAQNQASPGTVSFDDFFGTSATGSGPAAKQEDSSKDDLDQFQSWLQNLKR